MTAVLPTNHTVRSPTPDDAPAIHELIAAYNTAVVGRPLHTLDDAVDALSTPGHDSWLVFDGDRLAGFGYLFGKGERHFLEVTAVSPDPGVEGYLIELIRTRAAERARADAHASVFLDIDTYTLDTARRDRLSGYGFTCRTTFNTMRIDHSGPVAAPPPAGVTVHRGGPRRAAHEVLNKSFEGQFGFSPRSFEEWHAAQESHSAFSWDQLTVLDLDGEPVAMCLRTNEFVETDNCGYIGRLGVLDHARGRGLATFLLRDAFAADVTAGRVGTILYVDTNNPTRALGLYESVGMRPTVVFEAWRLEVAAR